MSARTRASRVDADLAAAEAGNWMERWEDDSATRPRMLGPDDGIELAEHHDGETVRWAVGLDVGYGLGYASDLGGTW